MTTNKASRKYINDMILNGTRAERLAVFAFDESTEKKVIRTKFKLFVRGNFPRYVQFKSPKFHDDMIFDMIDSYYGQNFLQIAFRGSAKTSLMKLFTTFVLLNDTGKHRKYIKVLAKDLKNSKQIVTDIYNLIIELAHHYGNVFESDSEKKREETMTSFTLNDGRKLTSGTVGQTQRGHVQDAYRPDWIWFEDCEDKASVGSAVITQGIIDRASEAINGLSVNGSFYMTANYISDQGVVQWFKDKPSVKSRITPLLLDDRDNTSVTWEMFDPAKVEMIRKDSRDEFWGEYQCDPMRSDNRFFNTEKIDQALRNCREPDRQAVGVKYWVTYKPNHRYGMGSDHSEGVGLDSNTLALFDFDTGELGVTYANNQIGPDMAIHEFVKVGQKFGECLFAPEVNNKCGGTAITTLKNLEYPNIYQHVDETKTKGIVSTKYGWETNSKTKYTMFYEFKEAFEDDLVKIYDKNVLMEMKAYSNTDLRDDKAGLITRHFDLLTAVVIAWQMRKHAQKTSTQGDYKKSYQKYINSQS